MKLTSQEEYGLRCLAGLARPPRDGSPEDATVVLTVNQIAEQEGLSTEYAGKLLGILTRAGIVESVRGRNGGYRLARSAKEITLAEALDALGGKLYTEDTCDRFSGDHELCVHTSACSIRSLWFGIQQLIDGVLTRTTIWDLIHSSAKHPGRQTPAPASFEIPDDTDIVARKHGTAS